MSSLDVSTFFMLMKMFTSAFLYRLIQRDLSLAFAAKIFTIKVSWLYSPHKVNVFILNTRLFSFMGFFFVM